MSEPVSPQTFLDILQRIEERQIETFARLADKAVGKNYAMPGDDILRLQALNVALSRSPNEPVDMALIAADKILQFLKGQMLTNGTQVH